MTTITDPPATGSTTPALTTSTVLALLLHAAVLLGIGLYPPTPPPQPVVHSLHVALIPEPAGSDEALRAAPDTSQPLAATVQPPVAPREPIVEPVPVQLAQEPEPAPEPVLDEAEAPLQEVVATEMPREQTTGRIEAPPQPVRPATPPEPRLRASDLLASGLSVAREGTRPVTTSSREHRIPSQGATTHEQFYLDAWARKVEHVGALNFPAAALQYRTIRCPTLHVALRADGHLQELRIARPCQDAALNDAAVDMVRMAAPFAPFPPELASRYDVLRFERVLVFQQ